MTWDWQNITAGVIVLAACGYLAYRTRLVWSARRQRTCGGCNDCPSDQPHNLPGFVPLDAVETKRPIQQ